VTCSEECFVTAKSDSGRTQSQFEHVNQIFTVARILCLRVQNSAARMHPIAGNEGTKL
jgi:hypothetical protein